MKPKLINSNNKLAFYAMDDSKLSEIPMYGDAVPAGSPSPAQDYLDMDLNLHDFLVQNPADTFCVRAIGDSMIDANIQSGDVMVVDKALEPSNNDIVLAVLDGEFTVKHIRKSEGELYLMPANENYQPIKITEGVDFKVWGVVTFIIQKANTRIG
tara:strand:- start:433 stop:897 length:465 start_codon:yes stop_codon:yes gene_type:complete